MVGSVLLLVHTGLFLASSIAFFGFGFTQHYHKQEVFFTSAFALFASALTYFALDFYGFEYIRWAGYALTAPFLVYQIARILGCNYMKSVMAGVFIFITSMIGLTILFVPDPTYGWLFFVAGILSFIATLFLIAIPDGHMTHMWPYKYGYFAFFAVASALYGLIYALGFPLTVVLTPDVQSILYFVLDFAKYLIVFINVWFVMTFSVCGCKKTHPHQHQPHHTSHSDDEPLIVVYNA